MGLQQLATPRHGGFTTFLVARLLTTTGAQMQGVALLARVGQIDGPATVPNGSAASVLSRGKPFPIS
jgi:hypothetical protein